MKILAFDPGVTTGYAIGVYVEDTLYVEPHQAELSQIELWFMLHDLKPDGMVCESFEYRNKARAGLVLYSVELIGIINLYSQKEGVPLVMQKASQGKGYYTDEKLKQDNMYVKGNPHANDATRHLLHWYTFGPGYKYNIQGYLRV